MKKRILALLLLISIFTLSVNIFGARQTNCAKTYSASGSTEGSVGTSTGVMSAVSGKANKIWKIIAKSDLSTGEIKIYDGSTTGATDNYTQVVSYDIGDESQVIQSTDDRPIYVAPENTQVKVGVTSTTANSLIVIWTRD